MKYLDSNNRDIHDIDFNRKYNICPVCSHNRSSKNQNQKVLQYYPDTNTAYCHHCNTNFFEYKPFNKEKQYEKPQSENQTNLSDKALQYLKGRKINQTAINKTGVYTTKEWMPQLEKEVEVICFPYYLNGELINIKYRGPKKSFKLYAGAEKILWNIDSVKESEKMIITEGEIDALSFITIGVNHVVSVPNGANKNLDYLDGYIDGFDHIKEVFLATDIDSKGLELRDELIRRFGPERCKIVSYKECKDANQFHVKYGSQALKEQLEQAEPVPIQGLVEVNSFYNDIIDLYNNGVQPGKYIQNPVFDEYVSWELGRLATVTGKPGSGKSEFVDYLTTRLNLLYGWKVGYFTPENYPLKFHYAKLHEKFSGLKFKRSSNDDFDFTYDHIQQNFFYILNEQDMTAETVLKDAQMLVKQKGIKILVIDPYNKLEHQMNKSETETQYISRFLDMLVNFARFNNVLLFLVAHPRKLESHAIPTLYDISGSANFYNKTDYGFTVHRKQDERNLMTNDVSVFWQKIKFKHLGQQGESQCRYNYNNGRFESQLSDVNSWDNSNWLIRKPNETIDSNIDFHQEGINNKAPF